MKSEIKRNRFHFVVVVAVVIFFVALRAYFACVVYNKDDLSCLHFEGKYAIHIKHIAHKPPTRSLNRRRNKSKRLSHSNDVHVDFFAVKFIPPIRFFCCCSLPFVVRCLPYAFTLYAISELDSKFGATYTM